MTYDEHETREPWFLRTWVIASVYAVAIVGVIAVTIVASIVGGVL